MKFPIGKLVATRGVLAALEKTGQDPLDFVARHVECDWGEVCDEDKALNDAALIPNKDGDCDRILSAYSLADGTQIWIITEWDRSVTTILLPEEY